ncbi:hypothetical protein [Streptomyces chattanoogensis]|uniref:hypothetical protein n=1 Tax=Streptomyces chattanoogensis TaxID=66876 RepID=UPI0036CBE601
MATFGDPRKGQSGVKESAVRRDKVTVAQLRAVRPQDWQHASVEWADFGAAATEARNRIRDVTRRLPHAWHGQAAAAAMRRLRVLLDEMTIAYRESRATALTLEAAHNGFGLASTWLAEAESMARSAELTLEDNGNVTIPDRHQPDDNFGPDIDGLIDQAQAAAVHNRAEAALTYAADVDFQVSYELARIKKAVDYSVLDDATKAAVNDDVSGGLVIGRSLSGQGQALLPPPAPDEGSGKYGSVEPTQADQKLKNMMGLYASLSPAEFGGTMAARNMLHYLTNTGEPLDLDVDDMLDDMPDMQADADRNIAANADAWKAQALAEYQRTGKPVKMVQQTGWQGFNTTSDQDWYHAVGACHYNTVAQVEVLPGPNGEPETKIRYQVHVADRYNWDGSANKSTNVPGLGVVTDKDMGRLHQAGLAKEFDMSGISSVREWKG